MANFMNFFLENFPTFSRFCSRKFWKFFLENFFIAKFFIIFFLIFGNGCSQLDSYELKSFPIAFNVVLLNFGNSSLHARLFRVKITYFVKVQLFVKKIRKNVQKKCEIVNYEKRFLEREDTGINFRNGGLFYLEIKYSGTLLNIGVLEQLFFLILKESNNRNYFFKNNF